MAIYLFYQVDIYDRMVNRWPCYKRWLW